VPVGFNELFGFLHAADERLVVSLAETSEPVSLMTADRAIDLGGIVVIDDAALSDDEAKAIDQHLAQSRSYDLDMQRSGSVPEELAARLDHSRHRVIAVLASALLNGSRRDLAEAAVDRELSDAKPGVCQSALEASASPDLIRVTELICTRCAAAAGGKKEPSPPQP